MKLSCLPVSYFRLITAGKMSLADWAREGASLGLDAVDISILLLADRTQGTLRRVRREIEREGIRLQSASTYPDFTHPDAGERQRQLGQFRSDLGTLAEVGVRSVRITAGQAHPGLDTELSVRRVIESFEQAVPWAQSLGLELLFENHSWPGAWQYPDFGFPTENFLRLARELRAMPIGIQFDTANTIAWGDDPLPVLEQVIDRVRSVHAADTRSRGKLEPAVIGTGLVPFPAIFGRLKASGYDSWVSIEEASGTGREGVAAAARFVREAWAAA
jgi:sugar phosphate isomerase/epimerase